MQFLQKQSHYCFECTTYIYENHRKCTINKSCTINKAIPIQCILAEERLLVILNYILKSLIGVLNYFL